MTTVEPGASEVLAHAFDRSPRSIAFFASRPAPIITDRFDVFVQLVIAAPMHAPVVELHLGAVLQRHRDELVGAGLGHRGGRVAVEAVQPLALVVVVVAGRVGGGKRSATTPRRGGCRLPWPRRGRTRSATRGTPEQASLRAIWSWGRFGPAIITAEPRSSSSVSENVGSSDSGVWNIPCSRA